MSTKSDGGPEKFNMHVWGFVGPKKKNFFKHTTANQMPLSLEAKMFPTADDVQCSQRIIITIQATYIRALKQILHVLK
jgi:hypothetical protein